MKERSKIDLGMTGYDELFMTDQERADARKPKVDDLPLEELKPFKNHPFKVREDEELQSLAESIRESGVLVPALARPTVDGYGYMKNPENKKRWIIDPYAAEVVQKIFRWFLDGKEVTIIL